MEGMASSFAARAALALLGVAFFCTAAKAEDYSGPRPPKADVPYLLHAGSLLSTEALEAKEVNRKDVTVFVVPGAASPVKTPMAEPIFIFTSDKIAADTLRLYRLTVNGANREVSGGGKKKKGAAVPLRLTVTQLGDRLYRVEAYESLDPGEYSLSPNGSNEAFCFSVY